MIVLNPIGVIHSPHKQRDGAPIQPAGASQFEGQVELDLQYTEGLSDLDGFERIILLYHFHLSEGFNLRVKPFLDKVKRGLFSTRAPRRPCQIGISIVKLNRVEGNVIHVSGVDMVDQTPLLDVKPYVPAFDSFPGVRAGWTELHDSDLESVKADNRFV